MKDFLRIVDPKITFQISLYPHLLKEGRGDYLIFIRFICLIFAIFFSHHCYAEGTSKMITLSEGLRLATDNNHLVKIASFNKSISSANTSIAKSNLLPNIQASFSQTFLAPQTGAIFG